MLRSAPYFCLFFLLSWVTSAQEWKPTSSPSNFLTDHSFGFSIEGKGYLVAGTQEFVGYTNAFWQYDPTTDVWTMLDTFPGPGRGYSIGDVWDGKAYMGFGTTSTQLLNDLWVFDADSMKWTALESCPCEPRQHPAMIALNGKIFVGLGNGNSGNTNDWWEYDIATDTWAQKPDFPGARRHHPYQFASGNYVYTGFGHGAAIYNDWYRYDPALETWEQMADLPGEGRVAGTQFSHNGKGYALSGDGDDHLSMEEGEFWEYDPAFNEWTQLPPHPGKSRWAPASFIIDGAVYLFNGTSFFPGAGYVYQEQSYKYEFESVDTSRHTLVTGKQWIFEDMHYSNIFEPFSDTTIETITVIGDTVINFKGYSKVVLSRHPSCWNLGTVEYLREEGEKIFRLSRNMEEEFLMIDFEEDSSYVMLYDNGQGIVDTAIVMIDSFGIEYAFDGTLLDVQYVKILNNQSYDDDTPYKIYRGIGFVEPGFILFPDLGTGLCDFQDAVTLRCVATGQDTVHFTEFDCFELQIISSNHPALPDAINIYPNPANDELFIESTDPSLSGSEWKIMDALGRTIKGGKFGMNTAFEKIHTGDMVSGFYFFMTARNSEMIVIQR